MTTYIDFQPSNAAPFQFTATLDGQQYTCTVPWNLAGQRFYLNVSTLSGDLVISTAMVGSPDGLALSGVSYAGGTATATTAAPHSLTIGTVVALTISGASPIGYNGTYQVLITGPSTFTYSLAADPGGSSTMAGAAYVNISLVRSLFASTLIWRSANGQFEISP